MFSAYRTVNYGGSLGPFRMRKLAVCALRIACANGNLRNGNARNGNERNGNLRIGNARNGNERNGNLRIGNGVRYVMSLPYGDVSRRKGGGETRTIYMCGHAADWIL